MILSKTICVHDKTCSCCEQIVTVCEFMCSRHVLKRQRNIQGKSFGMPLFFGQNVLSKSSNESHSHLFGFEIFRHRTVICSLNGENERKNGSGFIHLISCKNNKRLQINWAAGYKCNDDVNGRSPTRDMHATCLRSQRGRREIVVSQTVADSRFTKCTQFQLHKNKFYHFFRFSFFFLLYW